MTVVNEASLHSTDGLTVNETTPDGKKHSDDSKLSWRAKRRQRKKEAKERKEAKYEAMGALGVVSKSWDWYGRHAKEARRGDRVSDVALLVFGALIPVSAILQEPWSKAVSVILGILVVITTGLRRTYNWRDNWVRYTGACIELATASVKYKYKINPYHEDESAGERVLKDDTGNEVKIQISKRDQCLVKKVREIEESESKGWMASSSHSLDPNSKS